MGQQDITLHAGEPWRVKFFARDRAGAVLPLLSGVEVEFRLSDSAGTILTRTVSDGQIAVYDASTGEAHIDIPVGEQDSNSLTCDRAMRYEIRVIDGEDAYIQAEGRFIVEDSLFDDVTSELLFKFRLRFNEFTEDDYVVLMYLQDAIRKVDDDYNNWQTDDRAAAIAFLAAHFLQMRKNAADDHDTSATGDVRLIRVEDRSVAFDTSSSRAAAGSKQGLAQTIYGQRYLSMLRGHVTYYLAM